MARVTSRAGHVTVPVEVSDEVAPGVASLPHGFQNPLGITGRAAQEEILVAQDQHRFRQRLIMGFRNK